MEKSNLTTNHFSHTGFNLQNLDEINDFILNWFRTEGDSQELTLKLIHDLPLLFNITIDQSKVLVKDQYHYFKHLQRQSNPDSSLLQTNKTDSSSNSESTITSNASEDFYFNLAKVHVVSFPNLSKAKNLVLSCYFNSRNSASSVKTAFERFQRISNISERMFYYHTNDLYTKKYLILVSQGNPQLFKLNKDIFNTFERSSKVGVQPFNSIPESSYSPNDPFSDPIPSSIVGPSSSVSDIQLNLHNIVAYAPCDIHDSVFNDLRDRKHDFIIKRGSTHLRYWGRNADSDDFDFDLNGESFSCAILIYKKSIELKFKEDQGTDIILLVGSIMDRIMHILDWLKTRFVHISFPIESDFKLYNSTGQIYHLEVELENLATDLLEEYVKATGHHEKWWLIDDLGNKIGFDSSCRIKGSKRIPKVELKGDVVTLTNNLMSQFSAMAKGNVNVIKTHQKVQVLTSKVAVLENNLSQIDLKTKLIDDFTDQHLQTLQHQSHQLGQKILQTKQTIVNHISITEELLNKMYYLEDSLASNQETIVKQHEGLDSVTNSLENVKYAIDKLIEKAFEPRKSLKQKFWGLF